MNARSSLLAILLLAVVIASCGPLPRRGAGPGLPDRIPVQVVNRNFYDATIYAVANASRVRIGRVVGNSSARLSAPFPTGGQLGFEVRLLAVGAYTSYSINVSPGDTVRLVVPSDLHLYRGQPR